MWFRQIQIFKLTKKFNSNANTLVKHLEDFAFEPAPPTMAMSQGWVPPIDDEDAPLAIGVNGCIMLCLQVEEKILPNTVVAQALKDKVKVIEKKESRRVRQKEKLNFKDEIIYTLLPRAFSKFSKLYAYLDTRHQLLIVNTTNSKKLALFVSLFKKTFGDSALENFDLIKPSAILTRWLMKRDYPKHFSIEKNAVLQDPQQERRMIRCSQQDLFANSITTLVKDGCEVVQMGLCWQDRINFTLNNQFMLQGINLTDDDLANLKDEAETLQQKFAADFVLMSEMLTGLFTELLPLFMKETRAETLSKTGT